MGYDIQIYVICQYSFIPKGSGLPYLQLTGDVVVSKLKQVHFWKYVQIYIYNIKLKYILNIKLIYKLIYVTYKLIFINTKYIYVFINFLYFRSLKCEYLIDKKFMI